MSKHAVLPLDSVVGRVERYTNLPIARLHPLAKDYLKVSMVDIELWRTTDPQPLYRNEFYTLIRDNIFSVWCEMSPFNWTDELLHNHAEATADKLTAIIYGG